MRRLFLFFAGLFFITLLGKAQNDCSSFSVSKPYPVIDAGFKNYFAEEDFIMCLKWSKNGLSFQKFDPSSMALIKTTVNTQLPKYTNIEDVVKIGGKYLMFYSIWDKPNKIEQLFYRELDFEGCKFASEEVKLIHHPGKVIQSGMGWGRKFYIKTDYDESMLMIRYVNVPAEKSDKINKDIVGFYVYNQNMEPVWNTETTMPYTEAKMNNLDYSVDNVGNIYALTSVENEKSENSKETTYHLEMLFLEKNSDEFQKDEISLEARYLKRLRMYSGPNGKLICAGTYSNAKKASGVDGLVVISVDKFGKTEEANYYDIPIEIVNQYISERAKKKNEKEEDEGDASLSNFYFDMVSFNDDGSFVLIGEQYWVRCTETTHSNGRVTTRCQYHFDDMLIAKIDTKGELAWMKKLPKKQVSAKDRGGLSYQYFKMGNDHAFFYLDNLKNINLSFDQVPAVHQDGAGGYMTTYIVNDESGEASKCSIVNMADIKGMAMYQFNVDRILQISENQFAFEAYKKDKEDVLVKINLE